MDVALTELRMKYWRYLCNKNSEKKLAKLSPPHNRLAVPPNDSRPAPEPDICYRPILSSLIFFTITLDCCQRIVVIAMACRLESN